MAKHKSASKSDQDQSLYDQVYEKCAYINWRADEIKQAQVDIEILVREIEGSDQPVPPTTELPPVTPPPITDPPDPAVSQLIHKSNLQYVGAFLLPASASSGASYGFEYALTGLAYNPQHNSLYVNNHIYEQKTAEVSIPTPGQDFSSLPRAQYIQPLADLTEGHIASLGSGGSVIADKCQIGGLLVYGDSIIGTSYIFYDGGKQAILSHFTSGLRTTDQGDFRGFYQVGNTGAGFVAGFMCSIPPEWQSQFAGTSLTGQGCLSIISRTSYGPGAHVFNPAGLTGMTGAATASTPLVYYPQDHPTLGPWEQQSYVNDKFNMGTRVNGMVFPTGSRSVLFFGCQGLGIPCYGDTVAYGGHCTDPTNNDKGCHAAPYRVWCWAYSADELFLVKQGQKSPWDVVPYEMWSMDLPYESPEGQVQGVAYDPLTQRLYISHVHAEYLLPGANPYAKNPVIHVFQFTNQSGSLLTLGDEGD
jgi:hypothetical protein